MMVPIANFFTNIYEKINNWMKGVFKVDEIVLDFYNQVIAPLPEIAKILGGIFLLIIVLGIFSFVKKFIKTSIIIGVIIVIVVVLFVLL